MFSAVGLVVGVGFQTAARVGFEPGSGEVELAGRAGAAGAGQGFVGDDLFPARQTCAHAVLAVLPNYFDRRNFFAQAERHPPFAQVVNEAFDYFRVHEVQQPRAHVDQRHADAKRRKHARILASDDARTDHRQRARQLVELHDVVARKDRGAIQRSPRIARRLGADRQHDGGRSDPSLQPAHFVFEKERVRIDKARGRGRQLDAVAQKLVAQYVDLVTHHRIDTDQQILKRYFFLDPVRFAVNGVFAIARQVEDGFAHRLAGNGSDVHTDAADDRLALDHDDALAQLGALDCRMMSGGTAADDSKVEIKFRHRA